MIKLGKISTQTRGPTQNVKFYESLVDCAPGGLNIRAGSPCDI